MATGTVKTILLDKGFGFISPDDASGDGSDLFFHQSAVTEGDFQTMDRGDRVSFTDEPDPRNATRRRAVNVVTIDE